MSFFNHTFLPCRYRFLTFPCLWKISFSSKMISGTVIWLLGLDRIFMMILVIRHRSWRELDSWNFGGGLF